MKIISQRDGSSIYQAHLELETFQEVLDFCNNSPRPIKVYCKNDSNFGFKLKVDYHAFIRNLKGTILDGSIELSDFSNWIYQDGGINIK
jgi:hypothetical protein